MKNSGRGIGFQCLRCRFLVFLLASLLFTPAVIAHSPTVDAQLSDWCVGAFSNTANGGGRVEDSGVTLVCGNCSGTTDLACEVSSDCPGGESCVNLTSKTEIAWWDNRTDGAVNDLGTVAMTQDNDNLYIAAELWVDPDPVSLPFGQIAIDFSSGGLGVWHDPNKVLTSPGRCSVFTDRSCTSEADCDFCQISTEPTGACSLTTTQACVSNAGCPGAETCISRLRTCGSACDPDISDVCDQSQTCVGLGAGGLKPNLGLLGSPKVLADHLLLFDFSLWLIGAGDAVLLMQPGTVADANPWDPVFGCRTCQLSEGATACVTDADCPAADSCIDGDFVGDTSVCDFPPAVNPGASGGSGGPPGSIEVAIPWSAFGCTGCPGACSCPGFGPGQDFRFSMTVARGTLSLDYTPDGAHEDVLSEPVAGTTSTTTNSCAGGGADNTDCEVADRSLDAFIPRAPSLAHELAPGGAACGLKAAKGAGASITLDWIFSCSAADNDYGVYEGTIGNWYSHDTQITCTSGLSNNWNFVPGGGNHYYIVVPTDGNTEGSYSTDGSGSQRVPSVNACALQSLGNCP